LTVEDRLRAELEDVAGVWHLQGGYGYKAHVVFDETYVRGRFTRAAGTQLCDGKDPDDVSTLMISRDNHTLAGPDGTFTLNLCPACRRKAEHLRNPVKRAPRIKRHKWAAESVKSTYCLACGLDVTRRFDSYWVKHTWDCRLADRRWSRVPTCEGVWPTGWVPANAPKEQT
jgi:hypothetical protein